MWTSFRQVQEWHQPFFGQPALLLKDDDQWVLGGPLQTGPRTWHWVAYAGPSPARRILASATWQVARACCASGATAGATWPCGP
jgi:hypothetical protein